jgi:3-oxoacyl-[acyl-carrier protein] reductase
VTVHGDLALAEAGAEVVRQAADGLGRLDILVNNAGAILARQPFGELDLGLYQASLALNVR